MSNKNLDFGYGLLIGILIGILVGIVCGVIICSELNNQQTDDYFSMIYELQIVDDGHRQIQDILTNISSSYDQNGTSSNIGIIFESIAEWEANNYTNILVEMDNSESYQPKKIGHYTYDDNGLIRAAGGPYRQDPFWIAHYRYGACGELAALFAYTVSQLGFDARIVRADYADGSNNHAWVEVKVNEEWWFVDPTVYWEVTQNNAKWYTDPWYGPTQEFKIFGAEVKAVIVDETEEDVRFHYPDAKHSQKIQSQTDLSIKKPSVNFVIGSNNVHVQ